MLNDNKWTNECLQKKMCAETETETETECDYYKGRGRKKESLYVDVAIRKLSPPPPLGVFVPPLEDPETGEEGVAVYSEVREGLRALHNKGTSWQRGSSHGRILGGQILDLVFKFFLLDDRVRGSLEEQKYKYDGPGPSTTTLFWEA